MHERTSQDPFEQRIAGGLERLVAPAVDRRTAAEVAQLAMRPRGLGSRVRNALEPRQFLLIGIAALLLVPAAYAGADRLMEPAPPITVAPVVPEVTSVPLASAAPADRTMVDPVAILVRRVTDPDPGLAVYAVRPDGAQALVRTLPDTLAPGGTWSEWGSVSPGGMLALGVEGHDGWPVILVDLRDPASDPWVIDDASIGGIGPRWSVASLLAAPGQGSEFEAVVVADPGTRTTRTISMQGYGLVGGGPSIVWTADGGGFVGAAANGYAVVPLDGGPTRDVVGAVSDPYGHYGTGMAELRVCNVGGEPCPGGQDGRIERVEPDGSARTIWRQQGPNRALAARFGSRPEEYWVSVDHDGGRQVALVLVTGGRPTVATTVNRGADWGNVAPPNVFPGGDAALVWVDTGGRGAAVIAPFDGRSPVFIAAMSTGFADAATLDLASGFGTPATSMPAAGEAYRLPSLEELVAAEQGMNPGRVVLGAATHDAVDGDTTVRVVEVTRTRGADGDVYLDCLGPSPVTVSSAGGSTTSPCFAAGSYAVQAGPSGPVTVTASGDTSWRVVIYSQ